MATCLVRIKLQGVDPFVAGVQAEQRSQLHRMTDLARMQDVFADVQHEQPYMLAYSLAGGTACALLNGMIIVLAGMYFRRYKSDRLWWKLIVIVELVFCFLGLALIVALTGYEIVRIHDREQLGQLVIWDCVAHFAIATAGGVNLALTQVFLFYRCWRLSGRKWWVGAIGGISVMNVFAWTIVFGTTIGMIAPLANGADVADVPAWQVYWVYEQLKTDKYHIISRGYLLSATLTEWIMSGLLIFNLSRYQTSVRSSKRIIGQTTILAIQSSIPSTVGFTIELILIFRNDYHNYLIRPLMYFGAPTNLLIVLATLHSRSRLRLIARGGQDDHNDAMIAEALQRVRDVPVSVETGDVVASLAMRPCLAPSSNEPASDDGKDWSDDTKVVSFSDMFYDAQYPPARSPILGPMPLQSLSWHEPAGRSPGRLSRDPLASE